MSFLYPSFLFALLAIVIPVIIHLFSFRQHTTVYFSNVSYLRNIRKETKKKSHLKHLLILLSRILAIACLVLVFAQPYVPEKNRRAVNNQPIVAIYIDNSFSMDALSTRGKLIEAARARALEIAGAYPPGTRFRLLSNDFHPRHQRLFNKEQFIQQVSEIWLTSRSVPLSDIERKLTSHLYDVENGSSYIAWYLSDFQVNISDLSRLGKDTAHTNYLFPLVPQNVDNLYIDTCWMESPAHRLGQEEVLSVAIVNRSDESYLNLPVRFFLNDTLRSLGNFDIGPNQQTTVELKYVNHNSGLQYGYAEISDYPFTHDNTYFLGYHVQPTIGVLALYGQSTGATGLPYLRALFSNDEYIGFDQVSIANVQMSRLSDYQTIFIFNVNELSSGIINELAKAVDNGTTLVLFPEEQGRISDYNALLARLNANLISGLDTSKQRIAGVDWKHPVFSGVFAENPADVEFPAINGYFTFSQNLRVPESPLMWFGNRNKVLSLQPVGKGKIAVAAFSLSNKNSTFARDFLFVPVMYSLVLHSLPRQQIAYTIGKDMIANVALSSSVANSTGVNITTKSGLEFKPELFIAEGNLARIQLGDFFRDAGHYFVTHNDQSLTVLSMNFDRAESDLRYYSPDQLAAEAERAGLKNTRVITNPERGFSEIFEEIHSGKKLWKWFLFAAFAFLIIEVCIIRFWK